VVYNIVFPANNLQSDKTFLMDDSEYFFLSSENHSINYTELASALEFCYGKMPVGSLFFHFLSILQNYNVSKEN